MSPIQFKVGGNLKPVRRTPSSLEEATTWARSIIRRYPGGVVEITTPKGSFRWLRCNWFMLRQPCL